MKFKFIILIFAFLLISNTTVIADNTKKKCPKKVYVPGSKQYKGKKCPKKTTIRNAKYH